jgi:uncharacterized protein YfaS (alpha-2-macroglobulin family)
MPFLSLILSSLAFAQPTSVAVKTFTPQGYSKAVEQVRIEFAAPVVKFGDTQLAAPATSSCFTAARGEGRWIDTRNWVFDFKEKLSGGSACEVNVGAKAYSFNTGGPHVTEVFPRLYRELDPEQSFVLMTDAPVKGDSLKTGLYFVVDGLGDRIPAEVLTGGDAEKVLNSAKLEYKYEENAFKGFYVVVKASRPFAPKAKVSLVWSKTIQSGQGASSPADEVFEFTIADSFKANFTCQRESEGQPCIPILDMNLYLTERIAMKDAREIYLEAPDKAKIYSNSLDDDSARDFVGVVSFKGPFKQNAEYQLHIPNKLQDEMGKPLSNQAQFPLKIKTGDSPVLLKFASNFGVIEAGPQAAIPLTLRRVEKTLETSFGGISGSMGPAQFPDIIRTMGDVQRDNISEKPLAIWSSLKAEKMTVQKPLAASETEVIGVPVKKKGFFVVEMKSPLLGASLLAKKQSLYVRAAALVTNLAVHVKYSSQETWVWVTQLDNAQVVANAKIRIYDIKGNVVAEAVTDAQGLALVPFKKPMSEWAKAENGFYYDGFFAVAEKGDDFSFTHSNWNQGIESWRFQLPGGDYNGDTVGHAILDRTLFKPSEKMSAKLILRKATGKGLQMPSAADFPPTLVINHDSGLQSFKVPVKWDVKKGTAHVSLELPAGIKLGRWNMSLEKKKSSSLDVGSFSVENFRVPLIQARIQSAQGRFVADKKIPLQINATYFAGGPAVDLPMKLRWTVEPSSFQPQDQDLESYSFMSGGVQEGLFRQGEEDGARHIPQSGLENLKLNQQGAADLQLSKIKYAAAPQVLRAEVEFKDPSGDVKNSIRSFSLYPSGVVLGIKSKNWATTKDSVEFDVIALDLDQKPLGRQSVTVDLYTSRYYSHRKRLVGGFYAYEDFRENKKIGELCRGFTDEKGYFLCSGKSPVSGSVVAMAGTQDKNGNVSFSKVDQWISRKGESQWFGSQDNDRADLIPFKKTYEPGETAELQLRTPFAKTKVLVTVERESVLYSEVIEVSGDKPVIRIPIKKEYAPNVVISAFAIRGRVGDPKATALVDLAKPSFKLGMAQIKVGWKENTLKVAVSTNQKKYKVREKAEVKVLVTDAAGKPAKAGEVALIAVDEGLLELRPNDTWNLLSAMMKLRGHNVQTATAQSFVVGKRHFGLKAVASGGDGGGALRRELFDTLLYWNPSVNLNAKGEAKITVPLNDSTTSFRIVAVALQGADQFGMGWTSIQSSQDLMILPGLGAVTRTGDEFQAGFTVRNASDKNQEVLLSLETTPAQMGLAVQKLNLAPGAAKEVFWKMKTGAAENISYVMTAKNAQGKVLDEVKKTQKILSLRSARIFQSEFGQWPDLNKLSLQQPAGAIAGESSIQVEVSKTLGGSNAGIQDFWTHYAYNCLEQQTSRAVSLNDKKLWAKIEAQLDTYTDRNGLLRFFPSDNTKGDVNLTAFVLAIAHEAGFKFNPDREARLLDTLSQYAEGRLQDPSRYGKMDEILKKITVLEVLSRYRRLNLDLLSSVDAKSMTDWPLYTLTEWYQIHLWEKKIPQRDVKLAEIENQLRARFYFSAKRLQIKNQERDSLSWLMRDPDSAIVRLILATADQSSWKADSPRLIQGILSRQQEGSWGLTTSNAWGSLLLRKLAARDEKNVILGAFVAELEKKQISHAWNKGPNGLISLPWTKSNADLRLSQEGSGNPYITVSARAAVPVSKAVLAGFNIEKTITPVEQKKKGIWSVGDIARVQIKVRAKADQTWVVLEDPIPAGASLLQNSGATAVERKEELIRFYFAWFSAEEQTLEYNVRFNQAGTFNLPATRIEAMYSPDLYSELPESKWVVQE